MYSFYFTSYFFFCFLLLLRLSLCKELRLLANFRYFWYILYLFCVAQWYVCDTKLTFCHFETLFRPRCELQSSKYAQQFDSQLSWEMSAKNCSTFSVFSLRFFFFRHNLSLFPSLLLAHVREGKIAEKRREENWELLRGRRRRVATSKRAKVIYSVAMRGGAAMFGVVRSVFVFFGLPYSVSGRDDSLNV